MRHTAEAGPRAISRLVPEVPDAGQDAGPVSEFKRDARDVAVVVAIGVGYLVAGVVALWLAWLAVVAFLTYGYQAIMWLLF